MKKNFTIFIAFAVAAALLLSGCGIGGAGSSGNWKTASETNTSGIPEAAAVGDTVTLGTYEQDNDTSDGTEPIEWQVLDKEDGKALLISRYILDCKPYSNTNLNVTWDNSTLRPWLNNDFYNAAFSSSDREKIVRTDLVNEDRWNDGETVTPGGKNTSDHVFLLSWNDAEKYFESDEERKTSSTNYAQTRNGWYLGPDDTSNWYPRSRGLSWKSENGIMSNPAVVDGEGIMSPWDGGDYFPEDKYAGVRPAIWVRVAS